MCDNIIDAEKSIFRETEIDKYKVIRHKTIDWRLRETGKSGSRKNKYLVSRFVYQKDGKPIKLKYTTGWLHIRRSQYALCQVVIKINSSTPQFFDSLI